MNELISLILALAASQPNLSNETHHFKLEQSKLDGPDLLAPAAFTLDHSNLDGQDELEPNQDKPVAIWDVSKWDEAVWQ